MIWVEETKESLILVMSLRKTKCGVRRLRNEFHNKHCYLASIYRPLKFKGSMLVSLDCLNTLIMVKSATENAIPDVLGYERLPSLNRWNQG